jgi:hypothetical protein
MKEVNQFLTGEALTGQKLKSKKAVVIHWYASPMGKATNVIKYWQRRADGVSAHDCICLDGTVYHAVPYDQSCYQVGCARGYTKEAVSRLSSYPNDCVVGIECAHLDWDGKMTPETYKSLVELSARMLKEFNLTVNDLWLHSEIVGKDYKDCHRWFTTTKPSDWGKFKNDVNAILNPPEIVTPTPPKWDNLEFKKGQIGRLIILKDIVLWKDGENSKLEQVRVLKKGESFRVYGKRDDYFGQFNVGSKHWVTNIPDYVSYQTPSEEKLQQAKEYYKDK